MEIRLIVIRTADPNKLVVFYSLLELVFEQHKHSKGPLHYAATAGKAVLEIYPLAKGQTTADPYFRMGLAISSFEETIALLRQRSVVFHSEPGMTAFGYATVVEDPEGRKIELYKAGAVI